MSPAGLDRDRVAEVIVTHGGGLRRRGSGYRVTAEAVLTAAHVLAGAESVQVRFGSDLSTEWSTGGGSWWTDPDSDLAVVSIEPRPGERLSPARFGRVGHRPATLRVEAVGFPLWKLRTEAGASYRDSHHAVGSVHTLSNWRENTLEVIVEPAPGPMSDATTSPWEGMSGAALWAGALIVGVLSRHHPGDGLARLAAARLDAGPHALSALGEGLRLHDVSAPPSPSTGPDEAFAQRYREFMVGTLDRFEFFGVDPRGIARRHRFQAGYVPLTLIRRDLGAETMVSAGARADQALAPYRRALVRAAAGSGKSTLLRWLGFEAARRSNGDESSVVPFIVELGRLESGRPPELPDIIAAPLRARMPTGWVHRMLVQGRGLLLLDGLDEVRPRERENLEAWVAEYLQLYPDTRCVVTTRPSVAAEQWWVDRDFERFDLLPMSRHSIERYVRGWHEVARADQPDTPTGAEIEAVLAQSQQTLLHTLSNRPALRGMSASPLLCGLLCALHLERGENLPENRKQVYDAALDLLLVRWRYLRRRRGAGEQPAPGGGFDPHCGLGPDLPLRDEEVLKLFQRLAFWMVTNRQLVLAHDRASSKVASLMYGLRSVKDDGHPERDSQVTTVVNYLAKDSGLLRELENRSLEFVHRTFRDHLAAKEVVEESNITLMLDQADKPHWHDVVVMAGAHARPAERQRILLGLLERGRAEAEHRDALYLLAAAVLEQAAVLPLPGPGEPDVRAQVEEAIAELIPPRTSVAADQLADAGSFVLDMIPGPRQLSDAEAVLAVRALARIAARWNNPLGALERILMFTEKPTAGVINELLKAWGRAGDYEAYARNVLGEIDFGGFTVDLQNRNRIDHIGYLRTIKSLILRNDMLNLRPLADLPRLRRLTLRGNTTTSLSPLAAARSLRVLVLDRCSANAGSLPVDLAPLARFQRLRRLVIAGLTTNVDLAGLDGVRLDSLHLSVPLGGNPALPPGFRLRQVYLSASARGTGLDGVHSLRTVILGWRPNEEELATLAGLPELRRLVLWRVPPGSSPTLPGVDVTVFPRVPK